MRHKPQKLLDIHITFPNQKVSTQIRLFSSSSGWVYYVSGRTWYSAFKLAPRLTSYSWFHNCSAI